MTSKAGIGWVVGGIALVAAAICFFSSGEQGGVRVISIGVSPSHSNDLLCVITNTSDHTLLYSSGLEDDQHRQGFDSVYGIFANNQDTNYYVTFPNGRWRVVYQFHPGLDATVTGRLRLKVAEMAYSGSWQGLGRWVMPNPNWRTTYGPEMLGNKPAPPAQNHTDHSK